MSAIQFDATKVTPTGDRSAVPAGQYKVILKSSEIKKGKTDADKTLNLGFIILDGPIANQMIFQSFNIQHSNPVAQQIGQEKLSALCHAVGVLQITDTAQLHGRPLQLKVSVRLETATDPNSKKYNDIDSFLKEDGSAIVAQTSVPSGPTNAPEWAAPAAPAPVPAPVPAPAPAPAPQPPAAPVALPGAG